MTVRWLRSGWGAIAIVVLLAMLSPWGAARAADGEATAASGFIVDTGDGEPIIYVVVTFDAPSIAAIDLLHAADLDAVTVEFGGLGEAVCSIARTGCDVATCRQRVCQTGDPDSPFWQYWEQDPDGAWALSPLGASHAELSNGDIVAWVWTGPPPDLAPIAWRDLAERAGAPDAIASGNISGDPAVYASDSLAAKPDEGDMTGVLLATAAVAGVGVMGGWLVVRQRHGRNDAT